jgi:hypothetical protein
MSTPATGTELLTATVSAESAVGETVTFTISPVNADGSLGTAVTQTGTTALAADGVTITATTSFASAPGNYSYVPTIGIDSAYSAATGAAVPFTIVALAARTISGTATQTA